MEYKILKPINSPNQSSRKSKKPLMEKMRRARINESLNELKELVLDAMKKDASRYSKMEKADILEMTVKYLKTLHRDRRTPPTDDEALARYRAGYNECASEVSRYLMTADNVDQRLQTQILSHLALTYTQNKPTRTEQVEARIPTLLPATALPAMPSTTSHFNVLPSPPSSPLKARDKPLEVAASSAPVVIGNRVPAILVPSYARLHLLPFPPLQNSVGDTTVWRPW